MNTSKFSKVLYSLLVTSVAFHIWSLMRYPAPFVDEAWFIARAWAFIKTGRAFGPLDVGVIDRFEGYWTYLPKFPVWIQSLGLRLVDTPSFLPVRITSLIFGFLLLIAIYIIGNHLGGKNLGLTSALLVSLSKTFLFTSHFARYDIFAAALGFSAIAIYLQNKKRYWWNFFLSGLLVGLAFEIHPHSVIFGPAIVMLFFLDFHWKMFRSWAFWSFIAGSLVGLGIYLTLHILPYPQTYQALNKLAFSVTHTPPLFTLDIHIILEAISKMSIFFIKTYLALLPVILIALFIHAKSHSYSDRLILWLSITLILGATLLFRNKILYYCIQFTPAVDILIASFLLKLIHYQWENRLIKISIQALLLGALIGTITFTILPFSQNAWDDYPNTQNRINQVIQPNDVIMGSQIYWVKLHEHAYYSWEQLIYYKRYIPNSSLEMAMRELKPDIFIVDRRVNIADEDGSTLYSKHLRISKTELETFFDNQANLVAEFDGGRYGIVQVYRILWEKE